MTDVDIAKVKRNVATMVQKGAPEEHIDQYISQMGTTVDAVKAFKLSAQPRSFGEATSARASEAMAEKPSGLASFVRKKVLGFDPITPVSKAFGVMSSPVAAAGETLERKAGQMAGVPPEKLEPIARDTGDVAGGLTGILPGAKIATVGKELSSERHGKFINDLISPAPTKSVKEAQVGRTVEKGLNQKKVVQQTSREKEMAAQVKNLPVNRRKSLQSNYNVIRDANVEEAEKLQAKLAKNDVFIDMGDVQKMVNETVKEARDHPSVAASKSVAATVLNKFNKAILNTAIKNNNRVTASSLLQARKDFDASVSASHPKVFDATTENALTEMTYQLRTALNDLIESKVPDKGYKASLRKQNLLYEAMKNIRPKAAKEPATLAGRVMVHPVTKAIGYGAGGATAYGLGKHYLGGGQ